MSTTPFSSSATTRATPDLWTTSGDPVAELAAIQAIRADAEQQLAALLAAVDLPRPVPAVVPEAAERCGCHGAWSPDGTCPLPTRTENP